MGERTYLPKPIEWPPPSPTRSITYGFDISVSSLCNIQVYQRIIYSETTQVNGLNIDISPEWVTEFFTERQVHLS